MTVTCEHCGYLADGLLDYEHHSRAAHPANVGHRCTSRFPGSATLHGKPVRCELVAGHPGQHGHSFAARYWNDACPFEATDADECAMLRERSVAGVSNDVPPCPVHGAHPEARCGRTDPHRGHADPATAWRFCVGNVNIVTAQDAAR